MAITLTRVNEDNYRPDRAGNLMLFDLPNNNHHYFYSNEFTARFSEAGTLFSIIVNNKFIVQKELYSDITNGNTGQQFLNGGAVEFYIQQFINGEEIPNPGNSTLPYQLPFKLTL